MSDQTRFQPIPDAEWPAEIADLRGGFAGSLNVYRVMAHHPALLRAWQAYRDHVVLRSTLGRQRSEVVILRTGHRLRADYEWAHHVVRGRACGMEDTRIATLRGPVGGMSAEDALLSASVDDLVNHARLEGTRRQELSALVGPEGVLDLMAIVGLYTTLAFIVKSFETPVDDDVAEALSRHPAP